MSAMAMSSSGSRGPESFASELMRFGEGEVCGKFRYGKFLRCEGNGHWDTFAFMGDDPDCPNCYKKPLRKAAKGISERLFEFANFHPELELVLFRVRPWKGKARRTEEWMYDNRRTAYHSVRDMVGGYVLPEFVVPEDGRMEFEAGYLILGFKRPDTELEAVGEWTIEKGSVRTFSFDDLTREGRARLCLNLARGLLKRTTYVRGSSRDKYASYGGLRGFSREDELREKSVGREGEGPVVRVAGPPVDQDDDFQGAYRGVFGTTPIEERDCSREGCDSDVIAAGDFREYIKDNWLWVDPEERRRMDAKWYLLFGLDRDRPPPLGVKEPSKRIRECMRPDTSPLEWEQLADEITNDWWLTQRERNRTRQEIFDLVKSDFEGPGVPTDVFVSLSETWHIREDTVKQLIERCGMKSGPVGRVEVAAGGSRIRRVV